MNDQNPSIVDLHPPATVRPNVSKIDSLQIGMNWFDESPGGMERMVSALVKSLPAHGVGVRALVAASEQVRASTDGVVTPFASPHTPMLKRMLALRRSANTLRRDRMPDVVAAHFVLYAAPVLRMFREAPKVIHFHGPWSEEAAREQEHKLRIKIYRALENYTYKRGTRYIVLSNAYRQILSRYGVDESAIRIVPGCVDVARFDTGVDRRTARAMLDLPQDRPIVLCVRRLVSRMGLDDLIDAMRSVRQAVPDVMLVIAGKGPLASILHARVREHGLQDHVRLAGFVSEAWLPTWYRAADVSIVPTVALEGFGLTIIESLASGTPVLVTPVGGLPEAVAALSTDLVLERSGADALGAALIDALLGRIALPDDASCIRYARAHFDVDVVTAQIANVYREAIEHAR